MHNDRKHKGEVKKKKKKDGWEQYNQVLISPIPVRKQNVIVNMYQGRI